MTEVPLPDPAPDAIIAIESLSTSFDGGRRFVLRDVTLAVQPGTFVAVIGESGAGKTTLLKAINRLLETEHGAVTVKGQPVAAVPPHQLRRQIGYVFQAIGLFPHLTVGENIAVTPRLLGWSGKDIAARTVELLDLVHLPQDLRDRFPASLSGGQQQRVGVARALAARPSLMLMDEPFGALDPVTRDTIGQEYRRLHETLGLTTVMVTHDVLEAILLADRILVMRGGAIVADGTAQDLLNHHPDAYVREIMSMPRRQADRVQSMIADGLRS